MTENNNSNSSNNQQGTATQKPIPLPPKPTTIINDKGAKLPPITTRGSANGN